MSISDRREIELRTQMKRIIEDCRIVGELYGIPPETADRLVIIPSDGIHVITEEIFLLLKRELEARNRIQ